MIWSVSKIEYLLHLCCDDFEGSDIKLNTDKARDRKARKSTAKFNKNCDFFEDHNFC